MPYHGVLLNRILGEEVGIMRAVIVYESLFGNTHRIAEAIGNGVRKAQPGADVSCVRAAEAKPEVTTGADLLVVGGPTHNRRMSSRRTRQTGLEGHQKTAVGTENAHPVETGAEDPGVRDWFSGLPKAAKGGRAAAFDTRLAYPLAGGAARGIAHKLRRHGYTLTAKPEGFIVEGGEGPLRSGETERAEAWGAALVP